MTMLNLDAFDLSDVEKTAELEAFDFLSEVDTVECDPETCGHLPSRNRQILGGTNLGWDEDTQPEVDLGGEGE